MADLRSSPHKLEIEGQQAELDALNKKIAALAAQNSAAGKAPVPEVNTTGSDASTAAAKGIADSASTSASGNSSASIASKTIQGGTTGAMVGGPAGAAVGAASGLLVGVLGARAAKAKQEREAAMQGLKAQARAGELLASGTKGAIQDIIAGIRGSVRG